MKKTLFVFMLFSASASAQYAFPIEGEFSGRGEGELSLRTIVLDNEKGIVAASAFTGITGGCSGTVAGIGKYTGGTLNFTNYTKEEGAVVSLIVIPIFSSN